MARVKEIVYPLGVNSAPDATYIFDAANRKVAIAWYVNSEQAAQDMKQIAHCCNMYDRLVQSVKELHQAMPDSKDTLDVMSRAAYLLVECAEGETE